MIEQIAQGHIELDAQAKEQHPKGSPGGVPKREYIMIRNQAIVATVYADCFECAEKQRAEKWADCQMGSLYGPPYEETLYNVCMLTVKATRMALEGITPCPECGGPTK